MRKLALVLVACFAAHPADAGEWATLTGDAIRTLLTGREVAYGKAHQTFRPSGRTRYTTGVDSWGFWRVQGDSYCSQWPPRDQWDCYAVLVNGNRIRFVDASGNATDGVVLPSDD